MEPTIETARRGRPPKTPEYMTTHAHMSEPFSEFEVRVLGAKPGDWVETTRENIQKLNPLGLGGQLFFTYKNVKVCEVGNYEKLLKLEKLELEEAIFGKPNLNKDITPTTQPMPSKT